MKIQIGVLDPYHLVEEIEKIRGQGVEVTPANLKIAENVPLILSLHRELDAHRELASARGTEIGTTKRGIGPAYEDKVARRAIRLMDLSEPAALDDFRPAFQRRPPVATTSTSRWHARGRIAR